MDEFKAVLSIWVSKVPKDVVDEMYQTMDGWIAGLHLITGVIFSGKSAWIYDDSVQEVFDYFSFEVFSKFNRRLQNFLVRTAFVSPISIPMAEAISADAQAEIFLQDLHRNNYFTFLKRQSEVVYHFHPLFRDFLLQQASKLLPQKEVKALRTMAADMLLKAQRYEEAVECLRQSQNWERLVAVLLQIAPTLIAHGRNLTLLKWIGYVPDKIAQQESWLLFWNGAGNVYFNPKESQKILEQVFVQFEKQQDLAGMLQCWAYLLLSTICDFDNYSRLDKWIDKMSVMSSQGLEFDSVSLEINVTSMMLEACAFRRPDHPDLPQWVTRAKELYFQIEDQNQKLSLGVKLLAIAGFEGDFADARSLIIDCSGLVGQNKNKEKYRSKYLDVMERLGQCHEKSQHLSKAIKIYQAALEIHPSVERFYQRIMLCHMESGNKSEVVATYRRLSEVFSKMLHITPSARTQAIFRTVTD